MVNRTMWTTKKLIKALKKANGNCTNYKAALILGLDPKTVRNWDDKGVHMNDAAALKVASLLELNPEKVLVDLQAERTKDSEISSLWKHISQRLESVAASFLVGGFVIAEAANLPIL